MRHRDFANRRIDLEKIDLAYDEMRKELVAHVPAGRLKAEEPANLAGEHGRELVFELAADKLIWARMAFVGQRLYVLGVEGHNSSMKGEEVTKFFDSFKVPGAGPREAAAQGSANRDPTAAGQANPKVSIRLTDANHLIPGTEKGVGTGVGSR